MTAERTGPRLKIAAVAHRLGIAPGTLRTWDRRYGLGPTGHAAGAHRRYGKEDLARLDTMRRLVQDGVPAAEAARAALEGTADEPSAPVQFPDRQGHLPSRGGGRVLPLPGADDVVRGLGRAAMALDAEALVQTVATQLEAHGVLRTWESVLVPLLVSVGQRWAATGEGVEVEHLVSDCIATALRRHAPTAPATTRPLLLACAPDDLHVLPVQALAAGLGERGLGCRVLGPAVPAQALAAAVRRTGAAALFVWSQTPATGDPAPLAALPVTRPPTALVVGGPGWHADLPVRVTRVAGLGAAMDLMGQALNGEALASSG